MGFFHFLLIKVPRITNCTEHRKWYVFLVLLAAQKRYAAFPSFAALHIHRCSGIVDRYCTPLLDLHPISERNVASTNLLLVAMYFVKSKHTYTVSKVFWCDMSINVRGVRGPPPWNNKSPNPLGSTRYFRPWSLFSAPPWNIELLHRWKCLYFVSQFPNSIFYRLLVLLAVQFPLPDHSTKCFQICCSCICFLVSWFVMILLDVGNCNAGWNEVKHQNCSMKIKVEHQNCYWCLPNYLNTTLK